jgi:hypothetical protein
LDRTTVPAELKRAIFVESGHRCAIPRCGATELDVHHIVPWEVCKRHEYSNLIALCPVCHRRAHKGEIDRKALLLYKTGLTSSNSNGFQASFDAPIVEIKRRISETNAEAPGFSFEFDFPDFPGPSRRVVSKNLEAWGNELLAQLREFRERCASTHEAVSPAIEGSFAAPSRIRGTYEVIRNDEAVISVLYTLDRFFTGNVHGACVTRVQNFMLSPFQPVTISDWLAESASLTDLAAFIRERLIANGAYDEDWVKRGTEPLETNFDCFVFEEHAIRFVFDEYQIDCYAAGRQELRIGYDQLVHIANARLLTQLKGE